MKWLLIAMLFLVPMAAAQTLYAQGPAAGAQTAPTDAFNFYLDSANLPVQSCTLYVDGEPSKIYTYNRELSQSIRITPTDAIPDGSHTWYVSCSIQDEQYTTPERAFVVKTPETSPIKVYSSGTTRGSMTHELTAGAEIDVPEIALGDYLLVHAGAGEKDLLVRNKFNEQGKDYYVISYKGTNYYLYQGVPTTIDIGGAQVSFTYVSSQTNKATIRVAGARSCAQVITPAHDPQTGECQEFPTPCDVPQGWEQGCDQAQEQPPAEQPPEQEQPPAQEQPPIEDAEQPETPAEPPAQAPEEPGLSVWSRFISWLSGIFGQ